MDEEDEERRAIKRIKILMLPRYFLLNCAENSRKLLSLIHWIRRTLNRSYKTLKSENEHRKFSGKLRMTRVDLKRVREDVALVQQCRHHKTNNLAFQLLLQWKVQLSRIRRVDSEVQ